MFPICWKNFRLQSQIPSNGAMMFQCRYTNQVIANGFRLIRHPNTVGYLRRLDCAHHAGSMVGNVVWWEVKGGYRIGYIPKPSTNVSPLGL